MSLFITAEEFALAAASVGLAVEAEAPSLAAEIANVRMGKAADTVRMTGADNWTVDPSTAALAIVFAAGELVRLPTRLPSQFDTADFLVLTGHIVVERRAQPFVLIARPIPRSIQLMERLATFDPVRRPALVTGTVDLAMPHRGANLYPAEEAGGYVMRWIGPEPVLRLDLSETLEPLQRARPASVRIDIGLSLVYTPVLLAGLALCVGETRVPHLARSVGGRRRISAFLPGALLEKSVAKNTATLEIAMPLSLKEMPQALTRGARCLTIALTDIELTAHHGEAISLLPSPSAAPSPADALAAVRQKRAFGRDGFPALLVGERSEEGVKRFVALNAIIGDTLFHRLEFSQRGSRVEVAADAAEVKQTTWGYRYLAPAERTVHEARWQSGQLMLEGEAPAIAEALSRIAPRLAA